MKYVLNALSVLNYFDGVSSDDDYHQALRLLVIGLVVVGCESRLLFFDGLCRL